MSEALDFSRYAPERPSPVSVAPQPPMPDELMQTFRVIGASLALVGQCLLIAQSILRRRTVHWLCTTYHSILGSLHAAWSLCGLGWGCTAGLVLLQIVAR